MKPYILGKLEPSPAQKAFVESLKERRTVGALGEINPFRDASDVFSSSLEEFALKHGFKFRHCDYYGSRDITEITGSALSHVDEGYGLVISWVLDTGDLPEPYQVYCGGDPELVTNGSILPLPKHSVFVFNGDKPHGLISHSRIWLAQLTVSKSRTR
jgi:hypothetical protein